MKVIVAAPTIQSAKLFALEIRALLVDEPKYVTEPERLRALGPDTVVFWVTDVSYAWNEKVREWLILTPTRAKVLSGSLDQVSGVIRNGETP